MRLSNVSFSLVLPLLVLALGCAGEGPPPDAVARAGERLVRWPEVEATLRAQAAEDAAALSSAVLSALLDDFLDEVLLGLYARNRGWSGDAPVAEMLAAEVEARPVTDAEVAAAYEARRASFSLPARIRLRQVLVADRATADRAAARLLAGEDFLAVSRDLSQDPNAANGGEQPGTFTLTDLPAAFAEAIFALTPGEVSAVLEAPHGFHIFQVIERLPAEVASLERAQEELTAALQRERGDALLAELLEESRIAIPCQVFAHNLPFTYQGRYPVAGES